MLTPIAPKDSGALMRRLVEKVEVLWGDRGDGSNRAVRRKDLTGTAIGGTGGTGGLVAGAAWGGIGGTLGDQADLALVLDDLQDQIDAGSGIAATFETVNRNLAASGATLTYSGGELTGIAYVNGIIKTLAYSGGNLATITLSGATPGGIQLVKTFTYTGSNLTGIAYS